MSKYGDECQCTCEMVLVSCRNNLHDISCQLWEDLAFIDGHEEWDGDLGCLVPNRNPWDNAEEWVWNGDTPVVRKHTADQRTLAAALDEWEGKSDEAVALIGPEEQEALDALCQGELQDQYGMVCLDDGSYADFEARVTYRKLMVDGKPCWTEILWDGGTGAVVEMPETTDVAVTWQVCTCTPAKKFYCSLHNCQRDKETDPWRYWGGHASTQNNSSYNTSWSTWARCDHCFDTFDLPGKQHRNIKISAKRTHTAGTTPDFGLYAYGGWNPACVATFIPWQDYGLPTCGYDQAAQAIVHAWDLACAGKTVEVGCMGGHGRTGTILACIALLSNPDMTAQQAINHVRKVHCEEAIETNSQEWFIAWFASWMDGRTCPPKPTTYVTKHSANWHAAGSAATATKDNAPALPLASTTQGKSPAVGSATDSTGNKWVWCSHCRRTVKAYHDKGCPMDTLTPVTPAEPLKFDPALYGETANARRRNAKRANRRAARKAKRHLTVPQEYV